jgi:hypothetical protein
MTNSLTQKVFRWIFFILGVGTLLAGGIYIEKIALTTGSPLDYARAVIFSIAGIAITAVLSFKSSS